MSAFPKVALDGGADIVGPVQPVGQKQAPGRAVQRHAAGGAEMLGRCRAGQQRLAEADGISRQEATIRAIHEVAARRGHERQVTEASARARARYADVLDRLGR